MKKENFQKKSGYWQNSVFCDSSILYSPFSNPNFAVKLAERSNLSFLLSVYIIIYLIDENITFFKHL